MLVLSAAFLVFRTMASGFWSSRSAPRLLLSVLAGATFFRTAMGRSDGAHVHYGVLFGVIGRP
jgi:hypothetical protein